MWEDFKIDLGPCCDDVDANGNEAAGEFLVIVDESPELSQALRYACRRAWRTGGRVALFHAIEPAEFQHWAAIGERMREEARQEAEEMLNTVASLVQERTGHTPVIYIREGKVADELAKLIKECDAIASLVLGAATGDKGPGPLVDYISHRMIGGLHVPVTIIPGVMTVEEIDRIT